VFSDPQSVTVNAVAQSLPRVGSSLNSGRFSKDDGTYVLTVSHSTGKRNQHKVQLVSNKIVTDPFTSGRSLPVSYSVFLTLDVPPVGFTNTDMINGIVALADWLKASTNANTTKLVGGEI
jgi:hypothetical protein